MLFENRVHPFAIKVVPYSFIRYIYSLIRTPHMRTNFVIRAYGLQELAQLYFPGNTPQSASAQLKKWMRNDQLHAKLTEAGYHSGQKLLTPRQVEIIVNHLGEP